LSAFQTLILKKASFLATPKSRHRQQNQFKNNPAMSSTDIPGQHILFPDYANKNSGLAFLLHHLPSYLSIIANYPEIVQNITQKTESILNSP
jgi:hypothetical protein